MESPALAFDPNEEFSPEQRVMVNKERGNYIHTYTGKRFFIDDPRAEDICIEDIAHALAYQCRFNGHVPLYYSVAQHSVLVSELVDDKYAMWGLLHDASEAYLPDVPRPFKPKLKGFKEIEDRILRVIIERFGLSWGMPNQVHHIDSHIVAAEANAMWGTTLPWTEHFEKIDVKIRSWQPGYAEHMFLKRYYALVGKGR